MGGEKTSLRSLRPLPSLSLLIGLVVLVGTILGTYLLSQRGQEQVAALQTTANIPAFHRIKQTDVEVAVVNEASTEGALATNAVGAITTRAIAGGEVVRADDIGPDLTASLDDDPIIVALPATSAQALGGRLSPGSVVEIIATTDKGLRSTAVVFTVDRPNLTNDSPFVLVLALPAESTSLAMHVARGAVEVRVTP